MKWKSVYDDVPYKNQLCLCRKPYSYKECRVTLRDSTISNKDKLRLIEQYLCDLDKGISSIFHIIKRGHNDYDTDKSNIHG